MLRYSIKRLGQLVFVVFGVTLGAFTLLHLVPGDPARTLLGARATPHEVAVLRHEWGLDRSLPVQYVRYLGRLATGNLGRSITYQSPVAPLIAHALPVTLLMIAMGVVFAVALAVPLAVVAALRQGRPVDHVIRAGSLFGLGMPPFWIGFLLLIGLALKVKVFPAGGYGTTPAEHLEALVLPGLTVAAVTTPILIRTMRAALIDHLGRDFVTAAHGRGLSVARVVVRHALRNTAVPTVSVLAVNIGYLLGGTAVIENVYGLPGIGNLLLNGIFNRDFDVVQSVTLCYALLVVVLNLATDLSYAALDPRVVLAS